MASAKTQAQISAINAENEDQQTSIDDHEGRITQNEGDIAQNTSDISNNAGNIATNTSDIAANTAELATIEDHAKAALADCSAAGKVIHWNGSAWSCDNEVDPTVGEQGLASKEPPDCHDVNAKLLWNATSKTWHCEADMNDGSAGGAITEEVDPQVGSVSSGSWCVGDGSAVQCNQSAPVATEVDPQVGDVSVSGKWCASDGSAVVCDQNAPTLTEDDPQVGTLTANKWCVASSDGSSIICTQDEPAGGGGGGSSDVTSGRVSYWKLDESNGTAASDSSGSNNGTLANGPSWDATGGNIDGALDFDGLDDVVTAGSDASLDDLGPMTVSAWIYPRSQGENNAGWIIGKAEGGNNLPTNGWMFALSNDETQSIKFSVHHNSSHLEQVSDANAVTLNVWNHVVVTWDGTTSSGASHIYVNTVEPSYSYTDTGSGSRNSDASADLSMGNNPGGSRTFDGYIDDVRIYDRVLNAAEIDTLFNYTSGGGSGGSGGDTLADLTCTDGQVAAWNNSSSAWECADDGSGGAITEEVDPQVGSVTSGSWCVGDGSAVQCNQSAPVATEIDPQVGNVSTSGKWCVSDGSAVVCDQDAPASSDTLTTLSCTDGQVAAWNDTSGAWECAASGGTSSGSTCPNVGDECEDGSYYIGQVGGNDIYATAAAHESTQTWNNGTSNSTTTGFASATDGPGNTAGLVASGDVGSPYDAAEYCDGLTNVHGHSDWYLPAKDELNLFWNGGSPIANVNTSGSYPDGGYYWSSSEYSLSNAWNQKFSDGAQGFYVKTYDFTVRCVRRGSNSGDTLSSLSCTDGQVAAWNNSTSAWECADMSSGGSGGGGGSIGPNNLKGAFPDDFDMTPSPGYYEQSVTLTADTDHAFSCYAREEAGADSSTAVTYGRQPTPTFSDHPIAMVPGEDFYVMVSSSCESNVETVYVTCGTVSTSFSFQTSVCTGGPTPP